METDEKQCAQGAEIAEEKYGFGKASLIVAGVIIAVATVGVIVSGSEQSRISSGAPAANNAPAIQVTAQVLAAAYERNEAAAEQRYGHRPIDVTGTALGLTLNFSEKPFLVLQGPNRLLGPEAELTEAGQAKAALLIKGTQVRLHCRSVRKEVGIPILHHCDIL